MWVVVQTDSYYPDSTGTFVVATWGVYVSHKEALTVMERLIREDHVRGVYNDYDISEIISLEVV